VGQQLCTFTRCRQTERGRDREGRCNVEKRRLSPGSKNDVLKRGQLLKTANTRDGYRCRKRSTGVQRWGGGGKDRTFPPGGKVRVEFKGLKHESKAGQQLEVRPRQEGEGESRKVIIVWGTKKVMESSKGIEMRVR